MHYLNGHSGARFVASPLMPDVEIPPTFEWLAPEVADEILSDPAFREIARALMCAKYLDLDITDPAVVRDSIDAGRRNHAGAPAAVRRPPRVNSGRHESVVYYMNLGELVKIGTSVNIVSRHMALGQPPILAIERGDIQDERARHRVFAGLRVHGEWFRHEDPLASYVAAVAAAFEADFGTTMEAWVGDLRARSRD